MKSAIGIIIGVILGIIVVTVVSFVLISDVLGSFSRTAVVQNPLPSPGISTLSPLASSSGTTNIPAAKPSSGISTLPSSVPPSGTSAVAIVAPPANSIPIVPVINFGLNITSIENTGLISRDVTGQITNIGT